ncbi:MAG: hypothetical protein Ct9H90mP6_09330 [Gammaproteobacteria bacterium]|nr:MAG: hypothetical protein Ct9H90mP6_09330 [Gammaproteobacteria bacterium]
MSYAIVTGLQRGNLGKKIAIQLAERGHILFDC